MKKITLMLSLVCASPFLFSATVQAHGGGVNASNCHHAPPNGAYHCHNGNPDKEIERTRNNLMSCQATLSHGDRGRLVKMVQQDLTRLGYSFQKIDGIFGDETEQIVSSFQMGETSLPVTGVVECNTYREMQNELRNLDI